MPGVIENSGASTCQRKKLFYGVCVPLRLFAAYFVYRTYSSPLVQGIVLMLAFLSAYMNLLGLNTSNDIWWSQKFHLLSSLKIVVCLLGGRPGFVPYLMLVDVIFGVASSVAKDPWTGGSI